MHLRILSLIAATLAAAAQLHAQIRSPADSTLAEKDYLNVTALTGALIEHEEAKIALQVYGGGLRDERTFFHNQMLWEIRSIALEDPGRFRIREEPRGFISVTDSLDGKDVLLVVRGRLIWVDPLFGEKKTSRIQNQ